MTVEPRAQEKGDFAAKGEGGAWLPWAIGVVGCIASLGVWQAMLSEQERAVEARFERDAVERELVIQELLDDSMRALETGATLFGGDRDIERQEFHEMASKLLELHPYIQALGWNQLFRDDERAAHEEAQRRAGLESYEITERAADGSMVAAARRPWYVAVQFLEPYAGNEPAYGFDVASEPRRREALERARDSGKLALTAALRLVQEREDQAGFLAFVPIYGGPRESPPVTARLRGFFVGVLRLGALVESGLARFAPLGIDIVITDESEQPEAREVYAARSLAGQTSRETSPEPGIDSGLRRAREIEVGGRRWRITSMATAAYLARLRTWAPWRTLFAALAFTLLATAYSALVAGRATRIDRLVGRRTRELRQANRALEAEVERRGEIERELSASRDHLEERVHERTAELEASTRTLQQAIARREAAEEALIESEERLRLTLGAAADGAWDWDLETGEVYFSDSWLESLGYERGEVEPHVSFWESVVHPDDLPLAREQVERHLNGETARYECENRLRKRSGEYRWNLDRGLVVARDAAGKPLRMVGTDTDISARKAAEEQQLRVERKAQQVQKFESLGVLAGGIAHDFNNMLVAILGGTDLALQALPDEHPAHEQLEEVRAAASRAADLTRQIHAYSGQASFAFERLDLSALVAALQARLRTLVPKAVRLSFDLANDLPPIEGDSAQLGQAVINLVLNAADALGGERGEVSVVTRRAEPAARDQGEGGRGSGRQQRGGVCLEVTDDGPGIDEAVQAKIFDPFFTTKVQGRGLGLAATLGIVRSHRGDIQVHSAVGRGTTVRIVLPTSPSAEAKPAAVARPPGAWLGSGTALVIDDDAAVRSIAEQMLRRIGFEVVTAADGRDGLEVFRRHCDDIVVTLLDMNMPRMNGAETFRHLREIRADARVVFSSGYSELSATGLVADDAHAHFIQKPYRMADLRMKLRSAIES